MNVEVGAQEIAILGARSAIGKVAGDAKNVRVSQTPQGARTGVRAMRTIGTLSALGKVAGHAMHARMAADCSKIAMAAVLLGFRSHWFSCNHVKNNALTCPSVSVLST